MTISTNLTLAVCR